ncbi:flagellar assembly protein T N-terminal domain-containing protein [Pseudoalteromonas umbrosa]|uniref:flagellar assembly protein T N-terminal domain-containing protein n=1 Tax=Pseudoalteromonas umbrosa TaxID=3048489 RepID=UPI0024C2524E|nr:flagellar assembly protein T N-terminal domain-containing protein [Pseudoalteromonas sp. B95]MDK1287414.1 flagellar assembly protein T N-terminal domain-containing protein [Pseudoalteromonas sp. B95]
MKRASITVFTACLLSFGAQAEWFEVTGYANAYTADRAAARQEAVQDAITQALIFSGATVTSVQTLADGVLAQDHIKIKSHGEIQEINLVSENTKDGVMSVTLHLDIFPKQQQCPEESFNKQITITQSQLMQPHQARLGQIFDIHKSASERMYQTLMQRNMTVKPIPFIDKSINVRAFFSQNFDYDDKLIDSLTTTSNSQYVLLSQITDLAQTHQLNSEYAFWQDDEYVRSFKIDFVAFDAISKDKVWQQHYSITGIWPYEKTKIVDVYSDTFWHTDYGKRIQGVFNSLAQDLNQAFACLPTRGRILHKDHDQLVINLGRAHGLKVGQVLSIAHRSDVAGERNQFFTRSIQTINRVKVTQVNAQNAIATNIQSRPMNNIQINDIVELIITPAEDFAL